MDKQNFSKGSHKNSLGIVIVISFLAGGLAGALFGSIGGGVAGPIVADFLRIPFQDNGSAITPNSKNITVKESSATIDVVSKVSPSVVSIVATQDLSELYRQSGPSLFPFDFFGFPDLTPPSGKQEVSSGTGFIVSSEGMIVTNKHVVSIPEAEYSILTNDGKQYEAEILSTDPLNDIAVLKIEGKNFFPVELGDSDSLQIGQTVIAIGNTLGEYRNTVTKGVISGIDRTITAGGRSGTETLEGVIQTDASINPGNSGGPLLNLDGQVIGVNTAIDREGESIGFAIPINEVKTVIESVEKYGKIIRPILGIRYIPITPAIAEQNDLKVDYGILVVRGQSAENLAVIPGSPADKAGIEENDIILEIDGQTIDQNHSLARLIRKYKPGDTVTLKILHDGKEKTTQATLEEFSE